MKVKQAMHLGVEWVEPNTPVTEIAKRMMECDVGAIPVGENDRLIGMVTDRDIICRGVARGKDIKKMTARDVMSKGIIFCRAGSELDDAVKIMEDKKVRRLPVIDDNKRMIGILSLGDVSESASHNLAGELAAAVSSHHA